MELINALEIVLQQIYIDEEFFGELDEEILFFAGMKGKDKILTVIFPNREFPLFMYQTVLLNGIPGEPQSVDTEIANKVYKILSGKDWADIIVDEGNETLLN